MIGHQRDIMATLGIDIWIPRDAVCEHNQSYLWRDSAQQENVSEIILPNTPAKVEPVVAPAKKPVQPQIKTVFEKIFQLLMSSYLQHPVNCLPF